MDRIPVLKIGDVLLVSVQVDLQDELVLGLQEDLADRISATGARGVIIDISGLEVVDSFVGRMISTMASVSRVLDARTVVVGIRPAVAITLVEMGLTLEGVDTALDLERGLRLLDPGGPLGRLASDYPGAADDGAGPEPVGGAGTVTA